MTKQEDETIATYDMHAASWASDHPQDDYDSIVQVIKTQVLSGSLIEIGCGGGQDSVLLVAAGYDYFGIDASIGMVRLAQRNHPETRFEYMNIYELAKLGRQYDAFWCNAVLLHIPKQRIDEAMQAISSVIRPGGVGFISLKDGDKEIFEERLESGRHENRIFVHWPKSAIEAVFERYGFEAIHYEYIPKSERSQWHRFVVRKLHDSEK